MKYDHHVMYKCNVCNDPRNMAYAPETSSDIPRNWWVSEDDPNFHVCYNCLNVMATMFSNDKLLNHVIVETRLRKLGYTGGSYAAFKKDIPDICPHCLSIDRNHLLAKILEHPSLEKILNKLVEIKEEEND